MSNTQTLRKIAKDSGSKKYILKNKRRFLGFIFFLTIAVSILIYTISVSGYRGPQYKEVFVNSGDTLWSIAEKYSNNKDIRHFIYNLKEINDIDTDELYADTVILVPTSD